MGDRAEEVEPADHPAWAEFAIDLFDPLRLRVRPDSRSGLADVDGVRKVRSSGAAGCPAAARALWLTDAFRNAGQVCGGLSRTLVPRSRLAEAEEIAAARAARFVMGDPFDEATTLGPVVSDVQRDRIRRYIQIGIDEGMRLVAGGPEAPEHLDRGYFVRPTMFSGSNHDTLARQEVFGPVNVMIPFDDEADAIAIANDSDYGLAGGVWAADNGSIAIEADVTGRAAIVAAAERVQHELGAHVLVNNAGVMLLGPFGSEQSDDDRQMIEVNLLGAITATEVFLDQLKDGGGDIVNISSVAGRTARAGNGVYPATKWGMNGWSESLRKELLPDVRVTLIEPGAVATELPSHITHAETKQGVGQLYSQIEVTADDIAEVIAFVIGRPRRLAIHEVLLRPAGQEA